jgi:hypothetical protein
MDICNCCCHNKLVDILAIKIPARLLKDNDKYQALEFAEKIMAHNKLDKKCREVIANWFDFIVCYEKVDNLKKVKARRFENGIVLYTKLDDSTSHT